LTSSFTGRQILGRSLAPVALEYLQSMRVVVLNGPRQSGKTMMMSALRDALARDGGSRGTFANLDHQADLAAARADPAGFVQSGSRPYFIDEVQRAGDPLVLEIKAAVDADPRPGSFVLAGSTRFLTAPTLSESLAGRAGVLDVWPFSQSELRGSPGRFIDVAFADPRAIRQLVPVSTSRDEYFELFCAGGFPEPAGMTTRRTRDAWYRSYLSAVIERDIREMARINQPAAAGQVLRALAALTSQEASVSTLHQKTGLDPATVRRYMGLLETVFLVHRQPVWSRNLLTRMVKNAKAHLVDSGLVAHLLGVTPGQLARPVAPERGPLTETFVYTELSKLATWADTRVSISHLRTRAGSEVDLVVEDGAGRVIAAAAKSASSVRADDFANLAELRDQISGDFLQGIVFYLGDRILPFGDRLTAVPLSALWSC
jgi:predicted AAA+ superfamily ATPase